MDIYHRIRLAHCQGKSIRQLSHETGLARETITKMIAHAEPPGYRLSVPRARSKLDGFTEIIDTWMKEDLGRPKKQRHTAKRIWDRLVDEHGFDGGYTTVKDYVRKGRAICRETFVPLAHPPGQAQADFGEALAIIDGVEQKIHFFVMALPFSDALYVRAYPAAITESWLDGHVHAFAFFGAVPRSIVYDNDSCLVSKINPDGLRQRTQRFTALLSHYVIEDRYARLAKGNDKGHVEGCVGLARRNFMVPVPRAASFEALNARLEEQCRKRQGDVLREHRQTIAERLAEDVAGMNALPPVPFEACEHAAGRVSSTSLVRFRRNDYSVPTRFAHQDVTIKASVDWVSLVIGDEVIAKHRRCYGREEFIYDPLHYLALLEHKPNALDQAAPLKDWTLPSEFNHLRRLMEARDGNKGKREYITTLRLLEQYELPVVSHAIKDAIRRGAISATAIKHLVLCQIEQRPNRLDLSRYPFVPHTYVLATKAANYQCLLSQSSVLQISSKPPSSAHHPMEVAQ